MAPRTAHACAQPLVVMCCISGLCAAVVDDRPSSTLPVRVLPGLGGLISIESHHPRDPLAAQRAFIGVVLHSRPDVVGASATQAQVPARHHGRVARFALAYDAILTVSIRHLRAVHIVQLQKVACTLQLLTQYLHFYETVHMDPERGPLDGG